MHQINQKNIIRLAFIIGVVLLNRANMNIEYDV